jgi:hypothetical protein
MFGVLGYASLAMGTLFYNLFLKDFEVRRMLMYSCIISLISSLVSYALVKRWNLDYGFSDLSFVVFTDLVLGTLGLAFS